MSTVVGRRSYRNTRALLREVRNRARRDSFPLIVTDGFEFYEKVIREVFWPRCIYGHVIKTRRDDRVIRVEPRPILGAQWRFEEAFANSEDSTTLNASFIERLNLTPCQGSAYLCRRLLCHSRWSTRLEEQLELLRCQYSFVGSHRPLKFGKEMRTPAMQACLAKRPLTLRDVFCSRGPVARRTILIVVIDLRRGALNWAA